MKARLLLAANLLHVVFVSVAVYFIAKDRTEIDVDKLQVARGARAQSAAALLSSRVEGLTDSVEFLAHTSEVERALDDPSAKPVLARLFEHFVRTHDEVDQVRWIDERGFEQVRVDRGPRVVPEAELQDKRGRYYFEHTMAQDPGGIYISPLDLNVEHGQVEVPHKPMIRVGTPLDSGGGRRGVLVVNFLGRPMLDAARSIQAKGGEAHLSVLDEAGHWLLAPNPADEFSWMLGAADASLAARRPEVWRTLTSARTGQVRGDDLWLWATTEGPAVRWTVVSQTPAAVLAKRRAAAWTPVVVSGAVFVLAAWVATLFLVLRTKQRRALEAVQADAAAEQQQMATLLDAICEGSDDAIFVTDLEGRITLCNDAYAQVVGGTPSEILGVEESELGDVEAADRRVADRRAVIDQGASLREEVFRRTPQGERIFDSVKHPLRSEDGEIFGMFGIARDITTLHQRETRFQESEERLYLLLNSISEGVMGIDLEGRCSFLNEAALKMLGYEWEEELLGKSIHALVHGKYPDGTEYPSEQCRALASVYGQTPVQVDDEVFWTKSGAPLPVEYRAHTLTKGGERQGVVITWLEVAERRAAEQRMRQLSLALEQSPDKVVITKTNGIVEYVNRAFEKNTGYAKAEVIGQGVGLLQSGETPPETYVALREALSAQRAWRGEFVNRRKDGTTFVDRAHIAPLVSPSGEVTHYVSVQEDITERKRLEDELSLHREHLEDLVDERTSQLEEARDKAERLAKAKSEFLANMSHEIRTPLNAVLGLARIGARESAGRETANTYRRIQNAGEHLLNVINDILDFSKAEAGKLTCEEYPFELPKLIRTVGEIGAQSVRDKGLDYVVDVPRSLPDWVIGDEHRVRQILLNFLSNAVKFTSTGEVRLRVRQEPKNGITFEVKDSGIGMTEEHIERLFRPFEQADGSTTRRFGGTGLGLSISHRLAEMMNGNISVESGLGKGSTFTVRLPLEATKAPSERVPAPASSAAARLEGLRVLAADDLEDNRFVLEDLLHQEGASVIFAVNGEQAVDYVRERSAMAFDVVLMDIQMPIMDGYHATAEIGRMAPALPVIGLTAHALQEERDRCLQVGMRDHVTKPIDPEELVRAILKVIGGSGAVGAAPLREAHAVAVEPAPEVEAPPPPQDDVEGLIDRVALDARYGGRRAFVQKLARISQNTHGENPQRLRDAVEAGDVASIQFIAHSLKGLGGNFEAPTLHALAKETEGAVKEGREDVGALGLSLAKTLESFLEELATY